MWRVEGAGGRFVEWDGDDWTADRKTTGDLVWLGDESVPVTPTGPLHRGDRDDELWVFLQARRVIPGPVRVRGFPPAVPKATGAAGVVY
jgi:hypothetical protein